MSKKRSRIKITETGYPKNSAPSIEWETLDFSGITEWAEIANLNSTNPHAFTEEEAQELGYKWLEGIWAEDSHRSIESFDLYNESLNEALTNLDTKPQIGDQYWVESIPEGEGWYYHLLIPLKQREIIFHKTRGHCAYCGCKLTVNTMQVDHVIPLQRGDKNDKKHLDNLSNKMPACGSCNYYKSDLTLEHFRNRFDLMIRNLERSSTVKALLRYGKVSFTGGPVTFYFEQMNKDLTS